MIVCSPQIVKVLAHAAFICCFICKLISHFIAMYAYMQFRSEQNCLDARLCLLLELV